MFSRAGRVVRSSLGPLVQLFLLVGCSLSLGCPSGGERLISIKLSGGEGIEEAKCWSLQRGGVFAALAANQAEETGEDHYQVAALPGELLMVQLTDEPDGSTDELVFPYFFPYIFRGDEKMPLVFALKEGLALLDGEVVCVDLASEVGVVWLAMQPAARLRKVRTLLLSGDPATDAVVLARMPGSGVTVAMSDDSEVSSAEADATARAELRTALIAAKPACLFVEATQGHEYLGDVIADLPDLTHLVISRDELPDLTKLEKLRFLGWLAESATLAPLAELPQLQGLWLEECDKVTDFSPLRKLDRLQTLSIGNADKLADLGLLADMRRLQALVLGLGEDTQVESIAPIGELTNLTQLAFFPMPPTIKDLSPLKELNNLRMLVVDEDSLEERQDEYDEIRKALPECEIVGYCMGSAWILVVVPAAVWVGLRRRRSAAVKVA